jgi:hypothetical protein
MNETFKCLCALRSARRGGGVQFSTLIGYFERLRATSSSNQMTGILADLFRKADPKEIDTVCYFTLGRIGPEYSDVLLGLGENLVRSSIALAAGIDVKKMERMKEFGCGFCVLCGGGRTSRRKTRPPLQKSTTRTACRG